MQRLHVFPVFLALAAFPFLGVQHACGDSTGALQLAPRVEVEAGRVLLSSLATNADESPLPDVAVADAPAFGRSLVLTREAISNALRIASPELAGRPLNGAEVVRITRRATAIDEAALKRMLTAVLQHDWVKDRGDLELRIGRPWTSIQAPAEPLTLNVLDLPASGVTPSFVVRFELRTAHETVGAWQLPVQARILREVWIARETLRRGQEVTEASLDRQSRDMLTIREPLFDWQSVSGQLDVAESLQAGSIVYARAVRARPVIRRGQLAEAVLQDGALSVTLKVEVLDDGAAGDFVRARNPQTRRELRGKVINEHLLNISI